MSATEMGTLGKVVQVVYADTSFLVSLLLRGANSKAAREAMMELCLPLGVSALGRLEFRTAIQQRVGREEDPLDLSSASEIQSSFEKCFADGEFIRLAAEPEKVWQTADRVAVRHTAKLKLRALDVWHMGHALVCGATKICPFDERMRRVAEAEELELIP